MSSALSRDRLLPPLAAGLVIWTLGSIRAAIGAGLAGHSVVAAVLPSVPPLLYWLLCLPAILRLSSAFPIRRGTVTRALLVHLVAAGLFAALYAQLMVWLMSRVWPWSVPSSLGPVSEWSIRFQFGVMSYGFLVAWGYVHEYFTAVRARDLAVARLETELVQAQLRALKAQLQPHFLFNTLHAVTVLIRRDAHEATRMVLRLSDLLRMTMVDAERQEAPLADELRFLRLYLEIEQVRFRERLTVEWKVPGELERVAVPTLLLQPLVENAIKHGIEPSASSGRVTIAAARRDGSLVLRVANDGAPLLRGNHPAGIGLTSVRGRLERLYGSDQRLSLDEPAAGGVEVTVELPFRLWRPPEAA